MTHSIVFCCCCCFFRFATSFSNLRQQIYKNIWTCQLRRNNMRQIFCERVGNICQSKWRISPTLSWWEYTSAELLIISETTIKMPSAAVINPWKDERMVKGQNDNSATTRTVWSREKYYILPPILFLLVILKKKNHIYREGY